MSCRFGNSLWKPTGKKTDRSMGKKWPIPGFSSPVSFTVHSIKEGSVHCVVIRHMPFRLSRATWKKSKNFFSKWDKVLEQQQPVSNYSSSIHFVWRSCAVWSLVCVVWSVNSALWRYMLYSVHYKNCQVRVVPLPLATGENSHNRWSGLPSCFAPSSPRIIIISIQYFPTHICISYFSPSALPSPPRIIIICIQHFTSLLGTFV